jgi:soluble lytic murein transglycosylase-like protein
MSIDPAASGKLSAAHVSLLEAGALAHGRSFAGSSTESFSLSSPVSTSPRKQTAGPAAGTTTNRSYVPHTPVQSHSSADPNQWDALLNRMGQKYNVPPTFLKAVMLSESGGQPDAVGDQGHSVGLFQLNDQGYGAGMGDSRFDPTTNADRAAKGLSEAWHAVEKAGYTGEQEVRAAYDYSFNPGGGWAYQGDSVVRNMNQLLADQGSPALA